MADVNVKDFILDKNALEIGQVENKKAPKKRSFIKYETVFVSGVDFAVKRTAGKSAKMVVFLVSQDQYYFKDMPTGTITPFTEEAFRKFTNSITQVYGSEGYPVKDAEGNAPIWIKRFYSGIKFSKFMAAVLDAEKRIYHGSLLKTGMVEFNYCDTQEEYGRIEPDSDIWDQRNWLFFMWKDAQKLENPQIIERLKQETKGHMYAPQKYYRQSCYIRQLVRNHHTESYSNAEIINQYYGDSGVRQYLHRFMEAGFITSTCELGKLFEITSFDLTRFLDYLFNESRQSGYVCLDQWGDPLRDWVHLWTDTLNMEILVYHKIVDKYPENLLSYHHILSYKSKLVNQIRSEQQWKKAVLIEKQYEYTGESYGKKFKMIAPKEPSDMADEAAQQSNCLASYINRVSKLGSEHPEQGCLIYFCRYASKPETSLVTVEVRSDGSLGQVYGRFNREPKPEAAAFVESWHEKMFAGGVNFIV